MFNIEDYRQYYYAWKEYSTQVEKFRDRQPNVPSGLTEGLALIALNEVYNNAYKEANSGDISSIDDCQKVEVKASGMGFDRNDCSSFGPTELFDKLIFVECDLKQNKIRVFDCNTSYNQLQNLFVSKKETFGDQCRQKRRPRFSIKKKLKDQMTLLKEFEF